MGPRLVSMRVAWGPGLVSMRIPRGPGLVRMRIPQGPRLVSMRVAWGPGLVGSIRVWTSSLMGPGLVSGRSWPRRLAKGLLDLRLEYQPHAVRSLHVPSCQFGRKAHRVQLAPDRVGDLPGDTCVHVCMCMPGAHVHVHLCGGGCTEGCA